MACCESSCWKWMVLCACFMVNLILEGSFSTFGVMYTDLFLYFRTTKSRVAWVGSLFFSLPLISGAVASAIAAKFGCRFAAILGGIFAALGILASVFVTSIELMYLTFGCVTGLACSLPYVASVLILSHYFDTRLGLVNGIAECGASVGTIAVPIVFEELLSTYGWRGTMMVLSGFTLNIVVCGSLLRSAKRKTNKDKKNDTESMVTKDTSNSGYTVVIHTCDTQDSQFDTTSSVSVKTPSCDTQDSPSDTTSSMSVNIPTCNTQDSPSDTTSSMSVNIPTCNTQDNPSDTTSSMTVKTPNCNTQDRPSDTTSSMTVKTPNCNTQDSPSDTTSSMSVKIPTRDTENTASHNLTGSSILQNSKANLQNDKVLEKEDISKISKGSGTIKLDNRSPEIGSSNTKAITELEETKSSWCKICMSGLRLGIFKNVQFSVYIAIIFVLYLWIDVPYVYLPDRAIGLGISKKRAALLLSCIGIFQLVGNILFGYVGDHKRIDNVVVFGISVVLSGISLALVPLFTTFGPLAALAGAFGFFTAAAESMCSVMLVEFLSVHKLGIGYGYGMTLRGIAELIGPPVAGWLFDISSNYNNTFYVSGGMLAACGLIYTPVAKVIAIHNRRKLEASRKK